MTTATTIFPLMTPKTPGELTARFGFLAVTGEYGLLPEVFERDFTGRATHTPRRDGVRVEFDRGANLYDKRPAGTAWVFVFADRNVTREEVLALFPEIVVHERCVFYGATATVNGDCGWDADASRPVSEPRCSRCDAQMESERVAQEGDRIRVSSSGGVIFSPCGYKSREEFLLAVEAAGLEVAEGVPSPDGTQALVAVARS